ncbi:type I methionyl aminopeptidase, partial [Candidatus Peregrinibacteria bacterium]|nr:type I methionyl aminopeptidase [Candidatus Peregrinibacteria bacterium]
MGALTLKTPAEIESMRQGGKILGSILRELGTLVEPGATPLDVEYRAAELFEKYQVTPGFSGYKGYPNICCIAANDHLVHAIPTDKPFQKGDLVKIDCGCILDDLYTDAAISVVAGGEEAASATTRNLSAATKKALNLAIRLVKPGTKVGDLSHIIQKTVENAGFSVVHELTGHGVGYSLHEEPTILNYGKKGTGIALKPGMTFAIEPIV